MDTLLLSSAGADLSPASAHGAEWEKDYIRDGMWYVPSSNVRLAVTPERRAKWADTFSLMRDRGVSVPLTIDHLSSDSAAARRGVVTSLFNDGTRGRFRAKPADTESAELMARCPEVSLELTRNFRDGYGNLYDEAITAITLTPKPVVPGQEDWKRIAASRTNSQSETSLAVFVAYSPKEETTAPNEDKTMFKPEQVTEVKTLLGLKADASETDIATSIMDRLKAKPETTELDTTKANLSRVTSELNTAKAALAAKKDAPAVDPDALEEAADSRTTKLSRLVDTGRLTPAAHKIALTKLVGTPETRPTLCLSRKAATHAGLQSPVADIVIDILEANDPVELAKLQGEKTRQQTIELSRTTPGEVAAVDKEAVSSMTEQAFGKATK